MRQVSFYTKISIYLQGTQIYHYFPLSPEKLTTALVCNNTSIYIPRQLVLSDDLGSGLGTRHQVSHPCGRTCKMIASSLYFII
jgi:hypothetical protein